MNGAEFFLAAMREAGVRYLFGTPGTTEVPLLDVITDQEDIQYILTLHESIAVGMADGWARATGGPGVVNVHATVGTANTLGTLINAFTDQVPVVITAGTKDHRSLGTGVFSDSPYQITDLLRQYTKWSWQVLDPTYLGRDLSKAIRLSQSPVQGPVFIGIPENFWSLPTQLTPKIRKSICKQYRGDTNSVNKAVELLNSASRPILMVGNEVGKAGAVAEAVAFAEHWKIPVFTEERKSWTHINFPTGHPLYMGGFNHKSPIIQKADLVLSIGARMFMPADFKEIQYFSPETRVIQVHSDSSRIATHVQVDLGIISDAKLGLLDLLEASQKILIDDTKREGQLEQIRRFKLAKAQAQQELLEKAASSDSIKVQHLVTELSRQASKDVAIINEGVRSGNFIQDYFDFTLERSHFAYNGGCLGWGLPASMGVKLAQPEREVIAFLGDGSFLFTPQALWTAAHYGIGIKVVICNNMAYMAVKGSLMQYNGRAAKSGKFIGADFAKPAINFSALCQGFGVPCLTATLPDELPGKINQLFEQQGPAVLEVVLDPEDMEKLPE